MNVHAVIASFLAILVTISVFFLGKFLDVLTFPRNFVYFFMLSSYARDLQVSIIDLKAREDDIDKIIEEAERQSRSPVNQVLGWKRDIAAIIPEISKCLGDYERCRNERGFSFFRSNYSVGIRCADYLEKVKDLIKRGSFDEVTMQNDSYYPIPTTYEVPGSLKSKYRKAIEFLENDNSANVIGIWGMGGVGKTVFLKKMHNSYHKRLILDHVIWTVASSEQSTVSKVQSGIVKNLRLTQSGDVQSQACIIHSFLENKDFLLFIDNLWEAVDLLEIGVPDTNDRRCDKKRKVVFTTRQLYVCGNMEAKDTIKIECLNWEESWLLFKEKVGEEVIHSHPDISELAKDVAKECKGLPLALITIGRAMSKKSFPDQWKITRTLMRKSQVQDVSGTKKHEMQNILKISYDFLDSEVLKKCFLSISIWPEDFNISIGQLVLCWMGLDIIDNFESIEEANQIAYSYIGSLKAACLLEDGDESEILSNVQSVKMHDVLRDLAIWIGSHCEENKNKWIIKAGTRLPEVELKWSEAELISLMLNRMTKLPLGITNCPNLLTLLLRWNKLTNETILNCFNNFVALKYLDLCGNRLNGFPETVCDLKELQYLNLSRNSIENIPDKLRNLKKLKYLLLRENPIRNVAKRVFTELVQLLVLDLFCDNANIYGSNVEEIKCLENKLLCLGITVWSKEELNKLMLLSDLRIRDLCIQDLNNTSFHFMSTIPNPYTSNLRHCLQSLSITHSQDSLLEIVFDKDNTQEYLPSLNVTDLKILNKLRNLYFLNLSVQRIIWRDLAPSKLFANLMEIDFTECCSLEHVTWVIHLPSLQLLTIRECNNMRIAINDVNDDNNYEVDSSAFIFPSLKKLFISKMQKLKKLSTCSVAFPQLQILSVLDCPLLKKLPCELQTSPKIQKIWGEVEWWDELEWENTDSKVHFSQFFLGPRTRRFVWLALYKR